MLLLQLDENHRKSTALILTFLIEWGLNLIFPRKCYSVNLIAKNNKLLKSPLQQSDAKNDAKNDAKSDAKSDANVPENVPVNLTETQRKILEWITQNANITHSEMAKALSITERTARRNTKALQEKGFLHRKGSDKTGFWIIL